ncbi:DUF871 domain-containing protein [Streptococcus halotolerans]|uniref:DUF871 domain-containing protein n=1 Tax=Streptococcus halotolerans TaxID=1814128 RepID=UPI0007899234|nr:MupG family TIM beta-alpha barrel fold protein [Streptococcus halotolerans]
MVTFGFSIYPEKHELNKIKSYMDLLKKYGAERIFMSLLQLEAGDTTTFDKYKAIIHYANELNMRVIADISPSFIEQNAWEDQLILKAKEFGLAGLRLDEALSIDDIVSLTQNQLGLKIELNMSTDKTLVNDLLASDANFDNIIACHNFYPHEFTALSQQHFREMSAFYNEKGIETAAFVSSQTAKEGPWPLSEGLPTVEDHRHLPIAQQVQLMKAVGTIDNILISNQFISEEELKTCHQALVSEVKCLEVSVLDDLSSVEEAIVSFDHNYRGDISDYVIRSTIPRTIYTDVSLPPRDNQSKKVKRGSLIIDNDRYTRYKGELQIALKDFTISDKANVVGHICETSLPLLETLEAWEDFKLIIKS